MSPLRVVSFNCGLLLLRALGRTLLEVPHHHLRLTHLSPALRALEADVICLQEVFSPAHSMRLRDELREDLPYSIRHSNADFRHLSHGLLILSRHPVVSSGFVEYRSALRGEKLVVRRGVLEAQLRLPEGSMVRLLNTHTTAGTVARPPTHPRTEEVRGEQLHELTSLARARGGAVVACGDLNAGPAASVENYLGLLAAGWSDAFLDAAVRDALHTETWSPTNPLNRTTAFKGSPPQRIDHILLNEVAAQQRAVERVQVLLSEPAVDVGGELFTISDHYALVADLAPRG